MVNRLRQVSGTVGTEGGAASGPPINERFIDQGDGTHAQVVVTGNPGAVSRTDRSAVLSIAASILMPANTARRGFAVKNDSTIDIWINIGATAAATNGAGNLKIQANGGYYESPQPAPSNAISAIAASGTPAITAWEL